MKKCPQCGREYDLSMMFCLDDGSELLYGPAMSEPGAVATGFRADDEPQTVVPHETGHRTKPRRGRRYIRRRRSIPQVRTSMVE